MRLLHCADLHVGFRAYDRLVAGGMNAREHDVARTLTAMIDRMIMLEPDAIVVAGDVFHQARPSNRAIAHAYAEFSRLTRELPGVVVVMPAGNHDISKSDGSSILPLFANIDRVHVATDSAMRFRFPDRDLSILAVPDAPFIGRPELRPDASARWNVCVIHGEAMGAKQGGAYSRPSLTDITPDELGASEWNYVALGHFHEAEAIAPNVFYSGSIDYTSSNIWAEREPKGFIERDLTTGAHTFHELPVSRRVIDLPLIYGQGLSPETLDGLIRHALESVDGGLDDAVVRLVVGDVSRDVARAIDQKAIRSFKRRALFLNLDLRRPAPVMAVSASGSPLGRRRFSNVEERVREFCSSDKKLPLPADVDRVALMDLAADYLKQAAAKDIDSPVQAEQLTESLTESLQSVA